MDILSTSVGVLIGLVTTSLFRFANADFANPFALCICICICI